MTIIVLASNITELVDRKSVVSMGTSTMLTLLITNILRNKFKMKHEIWPILIAMMFSFVAALTVKNKDFIDYFIAFCNGILIYSSALGANEVGASQNNKLKRGKSKNDRIFGGNIGNQNTTEKKHFFTSWLK